MFQETPIYVKIACAMHDCYPLHRIEPVQLSQHYKTAQVQKGTSERIPLGKTDRGEHREQNNHSFSTSARLNTA